MILYGLEQKVFILCFVLFLKPIRNRLQYGFTIIVPCLTIHPLRFFLFNLIYLFLHIIGLKTLSEFTVSKLALYVMNLQKIPNNGEVNIMYKSIYKSRHLILGAYVFFHPFM